MTPTHFPAEDAPRIGDRTVVERLDSGVCAGLGNTRVLLDAFFDAGVKHCIVPYGRSSVTHWWLLLMRSGMKVVYFGTPSSFEQFQNDGARGNLFEFGRSGKVKVQ